MPGFWKHFNARERRNEQSQAVARLVITVLLLVYVGTYMAFDPGNVAVRMAAGVTATFLAFAMGLYLSIRARPRSSVARRALGIAADLGAISYFMYLLGPAGSFVYPVYLWVIVGNGLRFGIRYLYAAMAVGVSGFFVTVLLSTFWQAHMNIAFGLLIGMIVLPLFYVTILRELENTNRKLAEQVKETSWAATHDALTGLANRYLFSDRLRQAIERARRHTTTVAVLFIDIDNFKHINDTFGHSGGDTLLRLIATRIAESMRRADTVSRHGGDEFVVLLTDLNSKDDAHIAAERLMNAFRVPYVIAGQSLIVTGSIGLSYYPEDGEETDSLLAHADQAMYTAKDGGGDSFHAYHAGEG